MKYHCVKIMHDQHVLTRMQRPIVCSEGVKSMQMRRIGAPDLPILSSQYFDFLETLLDRRNLKSRRGDSRSEPFGPYMVGRVLIAS